MLAQRILLVDDDHDLVNIMTINLQNGGYEVISAFDGETGFQKALEEKPDLIILDIMMKTVTEGLRVAKQLHGEETTRNIPILMLSSIKDALKLDEDFKPDEINLPVRKFLEKPVAPDKLLKEVQELLEKTGEQEKT